MILKGLALADFTCQSNGISIMLSLLLANAAFLNFDDSIRGKQHSY